MDFSSFSLFSFVTLCTEVRYNYSLLVLYILFQHNSFCFLMSIFFAFLVHSCTICPPPKLSSISILSRFFNIFIIYFVHFSLKKSGCFPPIKQASVDCVITQSAEACYLISIVPLCFCYSLNTTLAVLSGICAFPTEQVTVIMTFPRSIPLSKFW